MNRDQFDQELHKRLSGRVETPPEDLWLNIEHSISTLESRIAPIKLRRPTRKLDRLKVWGYVAAALVLLGLLHRGITTFDDLNVIDRSMMTTVEDDSTPVMEIIEHHSEPNEMIAEAVLPTTSNMVRAVSAKAVANEVEEDASSLPENSSTVRQESDPKQSKTKQSSPTKTRSMQGSVARDDIFGSAIQPRKIGDKVSANIYAMGIGGGNSSIDASHSSMMTRASSFSLQERVSPIDSFNKQYIENIPKELKHHVPVSFGVALSWSVGGRWMLESGVVYTHLYSEAKVDNSMGFTHNIEQRLNYIGIPLALRYNIIDKQKMTLYAKAGGMIEKAVSGVSTTSINQVVIRNDIPITGVQSSFMGGIGLQYNIIKGMGLYVEPTVGYYFNNNQPTNYRTDNPLNVSLSVGLRFKIF